MRTDFARPNRAHENGRLLSEAWVVLELHFLSRPHLITEARQKLAETLGDLQAKGVFDPHTLKDRACRQIQIMYGPAPALGDEEPAQRWQARGPRRLPSSVC